MPATIDDLAAHLTEFFAERFPIDDADEPGSVLLVFDNLGRPLSPQEFTGSGAGPVADLLVQQRAADLADQLPAANALKHGWFLARGGSRLSRWYATSLEASVGPGAGADPADVAAFEAAKTVAVHALVNNELVAVPGGGAAAGAIDTYYATSMVPVDWWSDDATTWNTYRVAAADQPTPPPAGQAAAAPVVTPQFALLVADDPKIPEIELFVDYAVQTEPPRPSPQPEQEILMLGANLTTNAVLPGVVGGTLGGDVLIGAAAGVGELATPEPEVAAPRAVAVMPFAAREFADVARLAGPLRLQDTASAVVDASTATASTSRSFAVEFDYTLVRFDRPWWDDVFLQRHDWRLPGFEAGQLSSGSASDPSGTITLVTTGMLVIRNLSITANWSPADLAALPGSTSLGPFCIAAGGFDSATGTLSRKGMQAIGWLCLVPAVLPPRG